VRRDRRVWQWPSLREHDVRMRPDVVPWRLLHGQRLREPDLRHFVRRSRGDVQRLRRQQGERLLGHRRLPLRHRRRVRPGPGVRPRRLRLQYRLVSQRLLQWQPMHCSHGFDLWPQRRQLPELLDDDGRQLFGVGKLRVWNRRCVRRGPALREWKLRVRLDLVHHRLLRRQRVHATRVGCLCCQRPGVWAV